MRPGTGKEQPGKDDVVTIHYTGWKTDGTMFDSSVARGKPASFPVARVIAGFSEGLQLMVPGEKRRLWIPEPLAYKGAREPKGMLVFDIELIDIPSSRCVRRPTSRRRRRTRRRRRAASPTRC